MFSQQRVKVVPINNQGSFFDLFHALRLHLLLSQLLKLLFRDNIVKLECRNCKRQNYRLERVKDWKNVPPVFIVKLQSLVENEVFEWHEQLSQDLFRDRVLIFVFIVAHSLLVTTEKVYTVIFVRMLLRSHPCHDVFLIQDLLFSFDYWSLKLESLLE